MRYASLASRTLSRLDVMSSKGIISIACMSEALWLLERKCSQTVVGLELFVCLFLNWFAWIAEFEYGLTKVNDLI